MPAELTRWMPADVYFGTADPDKSLVDWRAEVSRTDRDDDAPPTKADLRAVAAVLGFDPSEINWDESS